MADFSSRKMTDADWPSIKNFGKDEFNYPAEMGYEFVVWLDEVRHRAGVPMHLVSDHRPPERNAAAGGASKSAHMDLPCNAIDIGQRPTLPDPNWTRHRFRIIKAAMDAGCVRIGMYPSGSLHLDRAESTHPSPCLWIVAKP